MMPFGYRFTMIAQEFALSICACNLTTVKRTVLSKPMQFSLAEYLRWCRAHTASYIYIPIVFICDVICESIMAIILLHCTYCTQAHAPNTPHIAPHTHTSTLTFNANCLCNSINAITKCLTVKIDETLTNSTSQQQHQLKWRKEPNRFHAIFAFVQIKHVFNLFSPSFFFCRFAVSPLIDSLFSIPHQFQLFLRMIANLVQFEACNSNAGKEVISTLLPICWLSSLSLHILCATLLRFIPSPSPFSCPARDAPPCLASLRQLTSLEYVTFSSTTNHILCTCYKYDLIDMLDTSGNMQLVVLIEMEIWSKCI